MSNILIVYYSAQYPLRATVKDHLYSFQRYAPHRCFYLNLAAKRLPSFLLTVPFDLIVFHTIFLALRAWIPREFYKAMKKIEPLKSLRTVKIALPQDEFLNTDLLCDFINEFDIQCVFSVMPEDEWPNIYHKVDQKKVQFFRVLTGYLEKTTVARINSLSQTVLDRPIDIGYRTKQARYSLGRHGVMKAQIAEIFQKEALRKQLVSDISLDPRDVFVGDAWYEFLLNCKYTIGIEGGASILDKDGTIKKKTDDYLRRHPEASFEEVEAHCFRGVDDSASLFAISPRHLEACATRTCQILIEGEYNGILKPGVHYIELRRDFSNLEPVLETIKQDQRRGEIVERAYQDIVESGQYTYTRFVEFVLENALPKNRSGQAPFRITLLWKWTQVTDLISWGWIAVLSLPVRVYLSLPMPVFRILRQIKRIVRREI